MRRARKIRKPTGWVHKVTSDPAKGSSHVRARTDVLGLHGIDTSREHRPGRWDEPVGAVAVTRW